MAFCQAAIDDSGNEPRQKIFVLAGFVAPAENWIAFALEWDRALKAASYPLAYAKFGEAMRLRGQFDKARGWTEDLRDEQLAKLLAIIRKFAPARFHASVNHADYQKYIRDAAPARVRTLLTDTPYILLAARNVVAAAAAVMERNLGEECAFYFDTQPGQDVVLTALWPGLAQSVADTPLELPPGVRKPRIVSPPRFESETDWLPLQASDLLAGAIRMATVDGRYPQALDGLEQIPGVGFNLEEDHLREMGAGLEQMMEEFAQQNPSIPLFHYDEKTARRTRKRARKGLAPNRKG